MRLNLWRGGALVGGRGGKGPLLRGEFYQNFWRTLHLWGRKKLHYMSTLPKELLDEVAWKEREIIADPKVGSIVLSTWGREGEGSNKVVVHCEKGKRDQPMRKREGVLLSASHKGGTYLL